VCAVFIALVSRTARFIFSESVAWRHFFKIKFNILTDCLPVGHLEDRAIFFVSHKNASDADEMTPFSFININSKKHQRQSKT
jgi:hypothetical protein